MEVMPLPMPAKLNGIAIVGLLVSFLAPFFIAFVFIVNYFFDSGATFLDASWFAELM